MDLTDDLQKHIQIIESITKPLVFVGQQLQVTPVSAFDYAMAELRDLLKPDCSCVQCLEEQSKDINIDVYISSFIKNLSKTFQKLYPTYDSVLVQHVVD